MPAFCRKGKWVLIKHCGTSVKDSFKDKYARAQGLMESMSAAKKKGKFGLFSAISARKRVERASMGKVGEQTFAYAYEAKNADGSEMDEATRKDFESQCLIPPGYSVTVGCMEPREMSASDMELLRASDQQVGVLKELAKGGH